MEEAEACVTIGYKLGSICSGAGREESIHKLQCCSMPGDKTAKQAWFVAVEHFVLSNESSTCQRDSTRIRLCM